MFVPTKGGKWNNGLVKQRKKLNSKHIYLLTENKFEYLVLMFIFEKYHSICPKWQLLLQIEETLEKNSTKLAVLHQYNFMVENNKHKNQKVKFTLYFSKLGEKNIFSIQKYFISNFKCAHIIPQETHILGSPMIMDRKKSQKL